MSAHADLVAPLARVTRLACAAALYALVELGAAQPVYRCGANAYSQAPCSDGEAIIVDDSRSAAQRAAAHEVAARESALAATMARDREAVERRAPIARAGVSARPASAPTRQAAHRGRYRSPYDDRGDFNAVVPVAAGAKR